MKWILRRVFAIYAYPKSKYDKFVQMVCADDTTWQLA